MGIEVNSSQYKEGLEAGMKDLKNLLFKEVLHNICTIHGMSDWNTFWVQGYFDAVINYVEDLTLSNEL